MASGPITSWEIDGETVETVSDFIFWAPKSLKPMRTFCTDQGSALTGSVGPRWEGIQTQTGGVSTHSGVTAARQRLTQQCKKAIVQHKLIKKSGRISQDLEETPRAGHCACSTVLPTRQGPAAAARVALPRTAEASGQHL